MRFLVCILTAALGVTAWALGPRPADHSAGRVTVDGDVGRNTVGLAPYKLAPITPSGFDSYDVRSSVGTTLVGAPAANTGHNLRAVLWRPSEIASVDQRACATFHAPDHRQQPGVALRIRSAGGRTTAVTVTKNVWMGVDTVFNVHVMDSGAVEPFRQLGAIDVSGALVGPGGGVRPYPWRVCARAEGETVSVLAWPAADPPPAWGDPAHGGQVTLPPGWEAPGRPGLYVGHLPAGHTVGYTSVTAISP